MRLPASPAIQNAISNWGLTIDPNDDFGSSITALNVSPPLLRVENFLTASQCDALINLQTSAQTESDLYLNYRVNQQVSTSSRSSEAESLISEFSEAQKGLSASARSGFRAQVAETAKELRPVVEQAKKLMGLQEREWVFEEGLWVRPSRRRVVIRDQTTVKYNVGEGVAPHVDGKDATLLVCLEAPEDGGRTVFVEEGIAVKGVKGAALVYESKRELLHFAEEVRKGRKWVLQLLIDFKVRDDEMDVDYKTGRVFSP